MKRSTHTQMNQRRPGLCMLRRTSMALLLALASFAPVTLAATNADAQEQKETRTYALIVAHNGSVDEGVEPLRYADDDGARYYETFSHLTDDTKLLTILDSDSQRVFPSLASRTSPPTRKQLVSEIDTLGKKIARDKARGHRVEVYLVFTGHGNIDESGEGYLSLADGKLRRSDLYREVIRPLEADYTHLIIDACHAYFMVQSRGGNGWKDDRSGDTLNDQWQAYVQGEKKKSSALPSTVGVILSTSGTAEVHEWSKLRAGVFSHQLRSGLLGAADVDGDGAVNYLELEAFLAAANAGVTNPRARISVYAKPPAQDRAHALISLNRFRDVTRLTLPKEMQGRYHIEDARGLRYADLNLASGQTTDIVLLRDPVEGRDYFLRREGAQARVALGETKVNANALAFADVTDQARSSVEESFRAELFSTPFGPSFYSGYVASRARYEALLEERDAVLQRPDRKPWRVGFDLSYHLARPTLEDLSGVQHNLGLAVPVRSLANGWSLGPYLGYGFSSHEATRPDSSSESAANVHRISLGAQVEHRFTPGEKFWIAPRARLGYQAVLFDSDALCGGGTCADPFGLRGEANVALGWAIRHDLAAYLHGGATLDFVTRTEPDATYEAFQWSPTVGVGLAF